MSTRTSRATLEALVTAQAAKLEELERKYAAVVATTPEPKAPKAPEIPHVQRGYVMRKNENDKWVPDETRPRIEIRGGCKQNMAEETFIALFITHHARLVKEFNALAGK